MVRARGERVAGNVCSLCGEGEEGGKRGEGKRGQSHRRPVSRARVKPRRPGDMALARFLGKNSAYQYRYAKKGGGEKERKGGNDLGQRLGRKGDTKLPKLYIVAAAVEDACSGDI